MYSKEIFQQFDWLLYFCRMNGFLLHVMKAISVYNWEFLIGNFHLQKI